MDMILPGLLASRRRQLTGLALLLTAGLGLSACTGTAAAPPTGAPGGDAAGREAGFAKGSARSAQGTPLPGARIVVGSTVFYNSNVMGVTDQAGAYRIRLTSDDHWRVYATIEKTFLGRSYTLDLHPENATTFASADGGIQDFTWKLTGEKVGGKHGTYGAAVLATPVDDTFETDTKAQYVQLTLTPTGPLIDGSEGTVITRMVAPTPNGTGIFDVPIGQYRVTAQYAVPGEAPVAMLVSAEGADAWAPQYEGLFGPARSGASNSYEVRLDVKLPPQ